MRSCFSNYKNPELINDNSPVFEKTNLRQMQWHRAVYISFMAVGVLAAIFGSIGIASLNLPNSSNFMFQTKVACIAAGVSIGQSAMAIPAFITAFGAASIFASILGLTLDRPEE